MRLPATVENRWLLSFLALIIPGLPVLAGLGDRALARLFELGLPHPMLLYLGEKFTVCAAFAAVFWPAAARVRWSPEPAPAWRRFEVPLRLEIPAALAFLVLCVNSFYLNSVQWHHTVGRFFYEQGWDSGCIERLFHGEVFYRDAHQYYGFLMYYPAYLMMKVLGHQLWVLQLYSMICDLVCLAALYGMIRFLTEDGLMSLLGGVALLVIFLPQIPTPHYSYARVNFTLIPGALMAWGLAREDSRLQAAGLLAMDAVFMYSVDYGVVSIIAMALTLIAFGPREPKRWAAGLLIAGVPLAAYCALVVHLIGGSAWEAVERTFVSGGGYYLDYLARGGFPRLGGDALNLVLNPGADALRRLVVAYLAYWPFLITALAMFGVWAGRLSKESRPKRFLCLYLALAFWGSAIKYIFLVSYSLTYVVFLLAPGVVLGIYFLSILLPPKGPRPGLRALGTAAVVVFLAGGIIGYLFARGNPEHWMRLASNPLNPFGPKHLEGLVPLDTPSSRGIFVPPRWKAVLEPAVRGVIEETRDEDSLYVFPGVPAWYFLTRKRNPLYDDGGGDSVAKGWPAVFEEFKRKMPKYVLLAEERPIFFYVEENAAPLRAFIMESYREKKAWGETRLMVRKEDFISAPRK